MTRATFATAQDMACSAPENFLGSEDAPKDPRHLPWLTGISCHRRINGIPFILITSEHLPAMIYDEGGWARAAPELADG
jgi:hypothetical protein